MQTFVRWATPPSGPISIFTEGSADGNHYSEARMSDNSVPTTDSPRRREAASPSICRSVSVPCCSFPIECRLPLAESPRRFAAAAVMPDNQHRLPLSLGSACALRLGGTTEATAGVRCSPKRSSLRSACGRSSPITSGRVGATCIRQTGRRRWGIVERSGSTSRSNGRTVHRPLADRADRNTSPRDVGRGQRARRAPARQRPEGQPLASWE